MSTTEANHDVTQAPRQEERLEPNGDRVVLRGDRVVARIHPPTARTKAERAKAHTELMELLRTGYHLGPDPMPSRDELHER